MKQSTAPKIDSGLDLSRRLFAVMIFVIYGGVILFTVLDLYKPSVLFVINDMASVSVFTILLLFYALNRLAQRWCLFGFLIETLRNLICNLVIFIELGAEISQSRDLLFQTLVVTMLFATVLGLAVHRNAALLVSALSLGLQFLYFVLVPTDTLQRNLFILIAIPIAGALFVVFYYRSMLEKLMISLSKAGENMRELRGTVENLNAENLPFVLFGKSTSGLAHDLRNKLNPLYMNLQALEGLAKRGGIPSPEDISRLSNNIAQLDERLEMVRSLTTSTAEDDDQENIDVKKLVDSVIYSFSTSNQDARWIKLASNIPIALSIRSSRIALVSILENLIRNAMEALLESRAPGDPANRTGSLVVSAGAITQGIRISVSDNGPGIRFCFERGCENTGKCLTCECFQIGKTSKSYGSGYGMVNVREALGRLHGTFAISTAQGKGTTITVTLPDTRQYKPSV